MAGLEAPGAHAQSDCFACAHARVRAAASLSYAGSGCKVCRSNLNLIIEHYGLPQGFARADYAHYFWVAHNNANEHSCVRTRDLRGTLAPPESAARSAKPARTEAHVPAQRCASALLHDAGCAAVTPRSAAHALIRALHCAPSVDCRAGMRRTRHQSSNSRYCGSRSRTRPRCSRRAWTSGPTRCTCTRGSWTLTTPIITGTTSGSTASGCARARM